MHVGTPIATCRAINDALRAGRIPSVVRGEVVPDDGPASRPAENASGAPANEADPAATSDATSSASRPAEREADANDARISPEDGGGGGGYDPELFDNLVYRYEEPDGRARWDRPLFTVLADDPGPPYDAIWDALIVNPGGGKAKAVRPNQATALVRSSLDPFSMKRTGKGNSSALTCEPWADTIVWQAPATAPDALHELDRSTAAVASAIGTYLADHPGESGGEVSVPGADEAVRLPAGGRPVTLPQVQRFRREFVALWRGHGAGIGAERAADGFVRFLNAKWEAD